MAWTYHGIFELELPYGKIDTSVKGVAVNESRVEVSGKREDAVRIWIQAQ